jgi:hypothetical protein
VVTIPPPAIFVSFFQFYTITYLLTYFLSLSLQPKKLVEAKKKKQKNTHTHTHTHTQLDFFFFFFTKLQEQNQNPKNKKHLLLALDNEELDDQET